MTPPRFTRWAPVTPRSDMWPYFVTMPKPGARREQTPPTGSPCS